jgi:predicted RNA-binding Zn-ribbon protein involved in translation (DUF1610 family)
MSAVVAAVEGIAYDPVTDATIQLWDAELCVDCNTIRHVDRRSRAGHVCPSCGSSHSLSLAKMLERQSRVWRRSARLPGCLRPVL